LSKENELRYEIGFPDFLGYSLTRFASMLLGSLPFSKLRLRSRAKGEE